MEKKLGDGLFRLLAPSVAGLLACVVCLCATSWAWFSASVTAAATTIRSASYTVEISVSPDATVTPVNNGAFKIALAAGDNIITLTRAGNASTGYCKVKFRNVEYYTGQLTAEAPELQFTVHAAQDELLTITPTWGSPSQDVLSSSVPLFSDGSPFSHVDEETQQAKQSPALDFGEESDDQSTEDKTQEEAGGKIDEPTDETNQPDEDPSGDSEPTTPGDNTPAEGDSGTNTGDSGDSAPASNATTPDATSASEPAPSASDGASEPTA